LSAVSRASVTSAERLITRCVSSGSGCNSSRRRAPYTAPDAPLMPMIRRCGGRAGSRFWRIAIPCPIRRAPGGNRPCKMRQSALSRREGCTLLAGRAIRRYHRPL
jgi:hypothetical protein